MDPNCCLSLCRDLRVELDFLLCCIIIIATTITFFFRGGSVIALWSIAHRAGSAYDNFTDAHRYTEKSLPSVFSIIRGS